MRKQGIDGTGMLNLYDRVTGIFNEIFDARLLTAAIFALVGYCTLFTQQKFPMRWMIFVLFVCDADGAYPRQGEGSLSQGHGRAVVRAARDDGGFRSVLSGLASGERAAADLLPHRLFRVRIERG